MITFRPIVSDFQIDGINMPKPYNFNTETQIISTEDSGRLAGNGAMQVDYLTYVFVTTWSYDFMTGDEYDLVYKNYIEKTIKTKNMYHTLKTINSNTCESVEYKIYTQDKTSAELDRFNKQLYNYMGLTFVNGARVYKDVTFTFVGVGGEDYESTQSSNN